MLEIDFSKMLVGRLSDKLEEAVDVAARSTAEFVIRDNVDRIDQQIDYRGQAQKLNAASTRRHKAKEVGHTIPLRWTGRLATKSAYRRRKLGPGSYAVELPQDRVQVVQRLRQKGYSYFGVSKEATAHFKKIFKQEFK